MAHKLHDAIKTPYGFSPKCILERPKLAKLLGAIAAEGTALELEWTKLYALLLGTRQGRPEWKKTPFGTPVLVSPSDDLAFLLFEFIQPFALRKTLTEKTAVLQLNKYPDMIRKLRNEVIPIMRNAMDRRNAFIHGLWGTSPQYKKSLIWISKDEDWSNVLVYDEPDFNEALETIVTASEIVAAFQDDLLKLLTPKE